MDLSTLVANLSTITISPEQEVALGLRVDVAGAPDLARQGLWWIQPLFVTRRAQTVGLVLLPGQGLEQCPLAWAKDGVACTLASSLRHAPAMLLYRLHFAGVPRAWSTFLGCRDIVTAKLAELDRICDSRGTIRLIEEIAGERAIVESDREPIHSRDEHLAARLRILVTLDDDERHARYRRWLDGCLRGGDLSLPPPPELGPWARQADQAWFRAAYDVYQIMPLAQAALRIVYGPASLDTPAAGLPKHLLTLSLRAAVETNLCAVEMLLMHAREADGDIVPAAAREHPLWGAVTVLGARRETYTGQEHVQAAAALDAMGRPMDAYWALVSAAFWAYVSGSDAGAARAARSARYLAEREGWTAVAERLAALSVHASAEIEAAL